MIYLALLLVTLLVLFRVRRQKGVVAFFHPYCNAGGGGERVLWCAIRAMQQRWKDKRYIVFSGDTDASKEQILMKARQRFGVEVDPNNLEFVFLRYRRVVEADLYPVATLVLQTIAGGLLGLEAIWKLNPEIFIDTMGYPLTLPLFRMLGGCRVGAYVHYPTISSDMIDLVERRDASYNNAGLIARNPILSYIKLIYYRTFAVFYGMMGWFANIVMVNGSWTGDHIARIWKRQDVTTIFPPCDVSAYQTLEQNGEELFKADSVIRLLSIGQIRPEKNHQLQIDILSGVIERLKSNNSDEKVLLTIAGGCRNTDDEQRVQDLKKYAESLGVQNQINWRLNIPYEDLLTELSSSLISLHTMWNEHFGISVVEGMAAGTLMIAHQSGGPLRDIVVPDGLVGFLASTKEEYVAAIMKILLMPRAERDRIRRAARRSAERFSEETFDKHWMDVIQGLF